MCELDFWLERPPIAGVLLKSNGAQLLLLKYSVQATSSIDVDHMDYCASDE